MAIVSLVCWPDILNNNKIYIFKKSRTLKTLFWDTPNAVQPWATQGTRRGVQAACRMPRSLTVGAGALVVWVLSTPSAGLAAFFLRVLFTLWETPGSLTQGHSLRLE